MLKTVSSITNSIGALNYKGTWDASTNVPALASGVGTKGDYYVVSVAGSTNLDGITSWYVGDWAAFNGSVWQRLEGGVDDPALSLKSNSTTGLMQITGPVAASTRVMTIPDANFTAARIDAAQTFTGVQTMTNGVGFGGSTLATYTEATTWTPSDNSGAGLTFTNVSGNCFFTRIGNMSFATFMVTFPVTADVTGAKIGGLPTSSKSTSNDVSPVSISFCDATFSVTGRVGGGSTFMTFYNSSGVLLTNANLSGKSIRAMAIYMV